MSGGSGPNATLRINNSADLVVGADKLLSIELAGGEVLDAAAITAKRLRGSSGADTITETDAADGI